MSEKLSERLEAMAGSSMFDMEAVCELLEEAAELARRVEWQPIETLPADLKYVLVAERWSDDFGFGYKVPSGVVVARDMCGDYMDPTHWMPLPEPPEGNCNE